MDMVLFDAICADIATHGNARRAIREKGASMTAFYAILARDEEAAKRYARAKSLGLDALADEILELSDESRIGIKTKQTAAGLLEETGDMVERSKLQVDARKWLLAKLAPTKYGDALNLKHSGQVGHSLTINRDPKPKGET